MVSVEKQPGVVFAAVIDRKEYPEVIFIRPANGTFLQLTLPTFPLNCNYHRRYLPFKLLTVYGKMQSRWMNRANRISQALNIFQSSLSNAVEEFIVLVNLLKRFDVLFIESEKNLNRSLQKCHNDINHKSCFRYSK